MKHKPYGFIHLRSLIVGALALVLFSACLPTFAQQGQEGQQSPQTQPTWLKARTIALDQRLLILPIDNDGPRTRLTITVDGIVVHRLDVCLAASEEQTDWNSYLEMDEYLGKQAHLEIAASAEPAAVQGFQRIACSAAVSNAQPLYAETLRPQIRFSQKQGWNNDPNGLVYLNGTYHLFWQSNPVGLPWGNMYWGHATSSDFVHWTEQPLALRPWGTDTPLDKRAACMAVGQCFSGSANIWPESFQSQTFLDRVIKPLFGDNINPDDVRSKALFAMFTDTQAGESLAVSLDEGRTWKYAPTNPAIPHRGRDPKLVWYQPDASQPGFWVVALYHEKEAPTADNPNHIIQQIAFYRSDDLVSWTRTGEIDGFYECPELYCLPVDGNQNNKKWVLWAANGQYVVGQFDGKSFQPDDEFLTSKPSESQGNADSANANKSADGSWEVRKKGVFGARFYAAQCFSQLPNGRVVTIGWAQIPSDKPIEVKAADAAASNAASDGQTQVVSMPFNQTFTVPLELSLKSTPTGIRLFAQPIEELGSLRSQSVAVAAPLTKGQSGVGCDLDSQQADKPFEVLLTLKTTPNDPPRSKIALSIGANRLEYDYASGRLGGLAAGQIDPIYPDASGTLKIRVLMDRSMFDLTVQDGEFYQPVLRSDAGKSLSGQSIQVQRIFESGTDSKTSAESDKIDCQLDIWPLKSIW